MPSGYIHDLWDLVKGIRPAARGYTPDNRRYKINKSAWDHGFKTFGEGAYSTVIGLDTHNKVVKITGSRIDGYHKYIDWIQNHGKKLKPTLRRHLPRIYRTEVRDGIRITLIEKLEQSYGECERFIDTYDEMVDILDVQADIKRLRMDMGYKNTMYRNSVPVITDPWAHIERESY